MMNWIKKRRRRGRAAKDETRDPVSRMSSVKALLDAGLIDQAAYDRTRDRILAEL